MRQKILSKNLNYSILRFDKEKSIQIFKKAGWHFNNLYNLETISKKIKTFPHKEYDSEKYTNIENIKKRINNMEDLFDRGYKFEKVIIDQTYPEYIQRNKELFKEGFPADFIAEGLDQTRGWFYTLTVLSVALFDSVAFKNCITTGMILAEDGRKMSKSLKNYPDPEDLLNTYGGDSLRAYLINSPVVRGEPLKFSEEGVKLVTRNVILPLWNSYSFFSNYANADEITIEELNSASPVNERPLMDQWIISTLQSLIKTVNDKMENYYLYEVIPPLMNFIDELTNWYVRSNRKRFWKEKGKDDLDKINAFKTLHEVLTEFSKTMAPVLPFICEEIYQGLTNINNSSIHFEDYPESNDELINKKLEEEMKLAKSIIKSVRNIRINVELPNKQPLRNLTIITKDVMKIEQINHVRDIILNELNIKEVSFDSDFESWVNYDCKPNYPSLGPKLGKNINNFTKHLANLNQNDIENLINDKNIEFDGKKINSTDIDIRLRKNKDKINQEIIEDFSILLDIQLDEELTLERISRELVSIIQKQRKDLGFDITDRISLNITTDDDTVLSSILKFKEYILNETLSIEFKTLNTKASNKILDYFVDTEIIKSNK